jgi:predicted MFS family arabinose efflux permease
MSTRQLKTGYFVIEGLNSFATVFYFYYFYFFMQARFGFGNEANLVLAALNGLCYMLGSWWGGRFAQRHGYFLSLKLGFGVMTLALAAGPWVSSAGGQIAIMVTTVLGMCLTWPTLEALVSENETRANLQHLVGLYNVIWAGTGALAYFIGGAMLEKLSLQSLFLVPLASLIGQLALTFWLERAAKACPQSPAFGTPEVQTDAIANPHPPAEAKMFLRLAWLSNPFAYIACNTLIAVMPGVAQRLELSTTLAGFWGSVWCFARVGAFFGLWFWPGWHYRFRWLLASFITFIATFAVILTVPNLAVMVAAQLFFGVAIGLIYYSSLFYSMDVGDTKGEHGGIHEAAIGLGNFAGPAVGAVSLHFLPQYAHSGAIAVSVLLVCGLGGLLVIRRAGKTC